ncbi:MAG: hypothetical protein QGF67_20905, partial [Lentisphaeria bacterium]|nr:hypothetical protein [Lentisphaeria bacterium]
LFETWGIDMPLDKVVGDRISAQKVNAQSSGRRVVTDYLPWMRLEGAGIEPDDVVTSEIDRVGLLSPGYLTVADDSPLVMTALLHSTLQSQLLAIEAVRPFPDPVAMLTAFEASNTEYPMAARFTGVLESAFPDGAPPRLNARGEEIGEDPVDPVPPHVAVSADPVN